MESKQPPTALMAHEVAPRTKKSLYPEPFASMMELRVKRPLGDLFGIKNFGVNLTTIKPGGMSALRHSHTLQDEFIYVVQGTPTLVTNSGETELSPGMCAGFKSGSGDAHHLINRTRADVIYLEVGDRTPNDSVNYPDDDLQAVADREGKWVFLHKDGRPY